MRCLRTNRNDFRGYTYRFGSLRWVRTNQNGHWRNPLIPDVQMIILIGTSRGKHNPLGNQKSETAAPARLAAGAHFLHCVLVLNSIASSLSCCIISVGGGHPLVRALYPLSLERKSYIVVSLVVAPILADSRLRARIVTATSGAETSILHNI